MTVKRQPREDDTPILEWIAGAIGLTLFAAAMVMTISNSFRVALPPDIVIRPEAATVVASGFRVEFEVENKGDETAAQVVIKADLRSGTNIIETHDVTVDFIPPRSKVRAGVFLEHDPAGLDLQIRASSYQHP